MSTATELLRRVFENLDTHGDIFYGTLEDIRAFLAAEPEAEPGNGWHLREVYFEDGEPMMHREPPKPAEPEAEPVNGAILPNGSMATNVYEAYEEGLKEGKAEPAARKPMTKDEIARGFYSGRWLYEDFEAGVRFAEKHHDIGNDDD